MKKMMIALLLVMGTTLCAQDVITLKTGEDMNVKVTKITDSEIEYKKWSNLEGPTYTKHLYDVFSVKYQNGEKDVFNVPEPQKAASNNNGNNNNQGNGGNYAPRGNGFNTGYNYDYVFNSGRYRAGARMDRDGGYLALDGIEISDAEASMIFSYDKLDGYKASRSRYAAGKAMTITSAILMGLGGVAVLVGALTDEPAVAIPGVGTFLGGGICLPIGLILKGSGKRGLNELAEGFNRQAYSENFSLDVSPSMLAMTVPTGNMVYGLGGTITLGF